MAGHLLSSGDDNNKGPTTTANGRQHISLSMGLETFHSFALCTFNVYTVVSFIFLTTLRMRYVLWPNWKSY